MAHEELDRTDMVGELLGKRQRRAPQTRNALSQRVVEPLAVGGLPRQRTEGAMLHRGHHLRIHHLLLGVNRGVLTVHCRKLGPQVLSPRVAAIAHVQGTALAGLGIHGDPHPLFVGLLLDKAGQCSGFPCQARDQASVRTGDRWHRQMSRQGLKTLTEAASEPLEGAPHRATNTPQRETCEHQAVAKTALILRDERLLAALDEWASTVVAMMVRLAGVNGPIFLVFGGLAPRTHVSHDHSWLLTSTG